MSCSGDCLCDRSDIRLTLLELVITDYVEFIEIRLLGYYWTDLNTLGSFCDDLTEGTLESVCFIDLSSDA